MLDPWNGASTYYVSNFREGLDDIAFTLSIDRTDVIRTRFNTDLGRAELYILGKGALASITVQGEGGASDKMIIRDFQLPARAYALFDRVIPARVEFLEA